MGHAPVETLGNGWCCVFALSESLRLQSPIELCEKMRALLLSRELYNTQALKQPEAEQGLFLHDGVKHNARLCECLDRELERKASKHGVYCKLSLMVEKIRYHRQRDEDPMMVFLTNTDAWQGDGLINLYAVWSGIDILVINMATESKIQLWTSKGLMKTLGYEPGHFGRNAEKGASYQPDVALYQMQWNYWCRVSLATAVNATLGPAGNLVPFNKGKVSAPQYEGSGQWRSVWAKFIGGVIAYIPCYRVLIKEPQHWNWATPDYRLPLLQRLGRKPGGVQITSPPVAGISMDSRAWWNTLNVRIRKLLQRQGLRLPPTTSWGYCQFLVGNVDWGWISVSPTEVTAFPRVHYQTGVNSLLESVMEGLLPSSKPVSLDSMVRLLDDHLAKFAFLYRTMLGVLCQPYDEAKKLLHARGEVRAKEMVHNPKHASPFAVLLVAIAHVFNVDLQIDFHHGTLHTDGGNEVVRPTRDDEEHYHKSSYTFMADPNIARKTTQTIHLAWLHCWDYGQMRSNSVPGEAAVLPPLFFLLEAGIQRRCWRTNALNVEARRTMVVAHRPDMLDHDYRKSGPPTLTALTIFDSNDGKMMLGPGDTRPQLFDVRPSGVVQDSALYIRYRTSKHVPNVGSQTGRGVPRAPADGWHEIIEVRIGGSKTGLKWQDMLHASWMSPQDISQRDGMIVLDHTPPNYKTDGTRLRSAGATVLSQIARHPGFAAIRAFARKQVCRDDIPGEYVKAMLQKNEFGTREFNTPWCDCGDFIHNGGSTSELLHGTLRHCDVGSNADIFLPRPNRPLPIAAMRVRTYRPNIKDFYLLRYSPSETFMQGDLRGKLFKLTSNEVKLVSAEHTGEIPDHQALFQLMFPYFRYIINGPLHKWVTLHDTRSPWHIPTHEVNTFGREKSGYVPDCSQGITELRMNRSNMLCPLLYKHARTTNLNGKEWTSLDFCWMLEHCHEQCVAMVMKGYRLTLREWLLFGPDGDVLFQDTGCSGATNGGTAPAINPFLRLGAICPVFKEVDKDEYCVARSLLLLDYVESDDIRFVGGWSPALPLRPLHQKSTGAFLGLLQKFNDSVGGYLITNRKVVTLGFDDHYAKKVRRIVDGKESGIAEVAVEDLETSTGVRTNHCMAVREGVLIEPSDGSSHAWPYPAAGESDQRWLRCVMLFIPLVKTTRNKRKGGPAPQPFLPRNKRKTVTRTATTTTTTSTTTTSTVTTTHTFSTNHETGARYSPPRHPGMPSVLSPAQMEFTLAMVDHHRILTRWLRLRGELSFNLAEYTWSMVHMPEDHPGRWPTNALDMLDAFGHAAFQIPWENASASERVIMMGEYAVAGPSPSPILSARIEDNIAALPAIPGYYEFVDDLLFLGCDTNDVELIHNIVDSVDSNTTYSETQMTSPAEKSSSESTV